MNSKRIIIGWAVIAIVCTLYLLTRLVVPPIVMAHCDTLDGPVVAAARAALQRGEVTPILRWVQPKDESEIRAAFQRTLAVRSKGPEARDLADRYFFETLVRIHRAGEGAPYDGLKPAGAIEPGIGDADAAIARGNLDSLTRAMSERVAEGIGHRFARVMDKKRHADDSVAAGREYVESYVEFIHYVERLYLDSAGAAAPHSDVPAAGAHQEREMHGH